MTESNLKIPPVIPQRSRILIAPLEWGLGHATRCIPLITSLISQFDASITIAANGAQQAILQEYFPQISFVKSPAFQIEYYKTRTGTILKLAAAVPGFLKLIRNERQWLDEILKLQQFDLVISDNRYGLFHHSLPCYFISHQLGIKTPFGKLSDRFLQRRLYSYINKFTACWVPDYAEVPGLAGELSHPKIKPSIPVSYIGPLSRIENVAANGKIRLLILLSGPEPQRTILENILQKQLMANNFQGPIVLLRGLPTETANSQAIAGIQVYNHLSAAELSQLIANADSILCRSGYSSMMELVPLEKKLFVIPTPGQAEQEYLARHLSEQELATFVQQDKLDLKTILQ